MKRNKMLVFIFVLMFAGTANAGGSGATPKGKPFVEIHKIDCENIRTGCSKNRILRGGMKWTSP